MSLARLADGLGPKVIALPAGGRIRPIQRNLVPPLFHQGRFSGCTPGGAHRSRTYSTIATLDAIIQERRCQPPPTCAPPASHVRKLARPA